MEEELFETTIEKIVTGGAGLGRREGEAAFIRGTVPGERVRARLARRGRGFVEARLVEVLEASPDRAALPEALPGAFAGCDLHHMSLPAQLRAKTEIVRDCFARLGKIDLGDLLEEPAPVGPPWGYRNKVRLHRGRDGRYGMHLRGTHEVVAFERSLLLPDLFNDEALPLLRRLPLAEQALVRLDGAGRFLAALYDLSSRGGRLAGKIQESVPDVAVPASCAGILANGRPVWGEDHLAIGAAGRSFRVHAHSFFQVNLAETENLVALLGAWIGEAGFTAQAPGPLLLDLYGGVGLFAIAFAERFLKIATVEGDRDAVRDAAENVRRDEISKSRVEIVNGFVEKVLERWAREFPFGDPKESVALVDPPRVGLEASAAESLAALAPKNIFYVSCDPSTLARDCRRLAGAGYRVRKVCPIDMFPQTAHVETLVWMEKESAERKGT